VSDCDSVALEDSETDVGALPASAIYRRPMTPYGYLDIRPSAFTFSGCNFAQDARSRR